MSFLIVIIAVVVGAVFLIGPYGKDDGGTASSELQNENNAKEIDIPEWMTVDLLPINEYSRPGTPVNTVNAIVIHYVGNPGTTAKQNRSYYGKLADTHETSASSNFLIGMDGEILECVPVNEVAYCSNRRNEDTLSIECCHPDETGKFTDDTYESLVKLTAWLCNELGLDSSDVIRHYDVTKKECPKYFVDHEDAWASFRHDIQDTLDDMQPPLST